MASSHSADLSNLFVVCVFFFSIFFPLLCRIDKMENVYCTVPATIVWFLCECSYDEERPPILPVLASFNIEKHLTSPDPNQTQLRAPLFPFNSFVSFINKVFAADKIFVGTPYSHTKRYHMLDNNIQSRSIIRNRGKTGAAHILFRSE